MRRVWFQSVMLRAVLISGFVTIIACSGQEKMQTARSADYGPPRVVGKIESGEIKESSGVAFSRCQPDLLWTVNDSGEPLVFALGPEGKHLGVWRVPGVPNTDWEALTTYKDAAGKCYLFIGNIGDNDRQRDDLEIYRIEEPVVSAGTADLNGKTAPTSSTPEVLKFAYDSGKQNAETLMVHPKSGDIYIVTKHDKGPAAVHKLAPKFGSSEVQSAVKVKELAVSADPPGRFTGGMISPDGTRVALCDLKNGYELVLPDAKTNFDEVWTQTASIIDLGHRPQGEGLTYTPDGGSLYATSEKKAAPLIRIDRR